MGEKSKQIQKSANDDAFHTSQNVHCVPAAFCIYSQKLKYPLFFQMFLCVTPPLLVSDELEMLDSAAKVKADKGSCHCTSSQRLCSKNIYARSQRWPLQRITHKETETTTHSSISGFPLFSKCFLLLRLHFLVWKFRTQEECLWHYTVTNSLWNPSIATELKF